MKGRVCLVVILLCILLVPTHDGIVSMESIESGVKVESRIVADYINHDSIEVDFLYSESNFTQSGTAEDPFIIENLRIETNQSCITVRNLDTTTVYGNGTSITSFRHLVIRNCLFVGIPHVWITGDTTLAGYGVYLYGAHNVTVVNNRFEKLNYGVYCFDWSISNIIKSNYFNCSHGVKVGIGCPDNIVSDNTFEGGPEHPREGTYGNGQHGVSISRNSSTLLINNTFSGLDSGIDLMFRGINTTIFNNTIFDSFYNGIDVVQSNFVVIANNTLRNNTYSGIWIDEESTNCTIANNTLVFNGKGFEDLETTAAAFEFASSEGGGGIWITKGSSGNTILLNDLIYNYRNALDEVPGNSYDFNFWTDYSGIDSNNDNIGDTPYYVEGEGNAVDEHPRMTSWSPLPTLPTPANGDTNSLTTYLMVGFGLAIISVVVIVILKRRTT